MKEVATFRLLSVIAKVHLERLLHSEKINIMQHSACYFILCRMKNTLKLNYDKKKHDRKYQMNPTENSPIQINKDIVLFLINRFDCAAVCFQTIRLQSITRSDGLIKRCRTDHEAPVINECTRRRDAIPSTPTPGAG
jgi:hypothetical protein